MKAIKTLAVRVENPTVARDRLHNMSQDRGKSVRAFGARLRGQAATCQYTKACTCLLVVDYTEENVADALTTGLADPEIKQGLLGEPDQPLSMERAMLYVESKETTRSVTSAGRRGTGNTPDLFTQCRMPRVRPHLWEMWKTEPRRQSVPVKATLDRECHLWHMLRHHDPRGERTSHTRPPRVRLNQRQMGKQAVSPPANQASVGRTDSRRLRPTEDRSTPTARTMQHRWHARHGVSELPGGYTHPPTTRVIPGKSDPHVPKDAGGKQERDTPPRRHHSGIFTTKAKDTKAKSKQMVYVTPSVTRLFLSRETCSDFGLISPQFPSTTTAAAASSIPLPGQSRFSSPHSTPSPPSGNAKARGPSREQRPLQTNTAPQAEKRTCGYPTRPLPPTDTPTATNRPNPSPRPSYGGEQECTGAALAVDIQSLHVQRLYTPTLSHDGRTTPASQCRPEGNTGHCTQGGLSARSLGEQSQRTPRPRCPSRGTGKGPSRHT